MTEGDLLKRLILRPALYLVSPKWLADLLPIFVLRAECGRGRAADISCSVVVVVGCKLDKGSHSIGFESYLPPEA